MKNYIAILGLLLLSPVILGLVDTIKSFAQIAQVLIELEVGFIGRLVEISVATVVSQSIYQLYLIPGLVLCSIVTYKYQLGVPWYWITLKVVSRVLFFCPPLLSVSGVYVMILSRVHRDV